jgi:hypothetical protein
MCDSGTRQSVHNCCETVFQSIINVLEKTRQSCELLSSTWCLLLIYKLAKSIKLLDNG